MTAATADTYDALGEAKLLLRTVRAGMLATLSAAAGPPFASLVTVAALPSGKPILLMSQLAAHTRHLAADPRLSLLLPRFGQGDPLAHPRLTLIGQAVRASEPDIRAALRTRFLARHPKAELYADFGDFSFWHIDIEQAHLNGGFARARNFTGAELATDITAASELLAEEAGALAHLNADHADALNKMARAFAGAPDLAWQATGLDPEGLDLAFEDETARVVFPRPIATPNELRMVLVDLAKQARARLAD
jgi:putative heme iron utilization protein